MPLNMDAVFGLLPTTLWKQLKKFIQREKITATDTAFRLSSKHTPALLIVMMCLSFANQFVRNVELDCEFSGCTQGTSSGRRSGCGSYGSYGDGGSDGAGDSDLNDFCWNQDTFLVEKAIDTKMKGLVTYPGVSGYDREKDAIIRQSYYKQVWLGLGFMAVVLFLPFFLWKVRGTDKLSLVEISDDEMVEGSTEDDVRVAYFIETLNFNSGFAQRYMFYKTVATVTPIITWIYFNGFLGGHYLLYGWNVLTYWMDPNDPWPHPMDVLFPKMAKCQWSHYGYGGDVEMKAAQCQLPMNNLTQWSFFLYWWWVAMVTVFNVFSTLRLTCAWACPCCRRKQAVDLVKRICSNEVVSKRATVLVSLDFGDWLILSFLKTN